MPEIKTPAESEVPPKRPSLFRHWATHPHHKKLRLLAIIGAGLLLLLVALLIVYLFIYKPQHTDPAATKKAIDILNQQATSSKNRTVASGMGFSVTYDTNQYDGYAVVSNTAEARPGWSSGEDFKDAELDTKRNYSIVQINAKGTDKMAVHTKLGLWITTNWHKNYFDRSKIDAKYAKMSDLDVLLDARKNDVAKAGDAVKSATKITINSQEFYKVIIEHAIPKLGVTTYSWDYVYLTVNDGSPYWLSINSVYDDTLGDVPTIEAMIAKVKFSKHDDNSLAHNGVSTARATLATSTTNATDNTTIEQGNVDSADAVKIVARNQIATVRIGVIRCADVTYRAENGASLTLKDTCNGGMGSGSIVTDDGYVITNGHVVTIQDDVLYQGYFMRATNAEWNAYYDFVVNAGYATRAELKSYIDKSTNGDKQATQDLEAILTRVPAANITVANDEKKIDVETSNTPFQWSTSGKRWSFGQAAGNITTAKLVDSEVDLSTGVYNEKSTSTDVALIKVDGSFPTVTLSSLSGVNTGDEITTMGFPGASDDKQSTVTLPTVSQGTVTQVGVDGGNHNMIAISAQIAAGNSGGPAFDSSGKQVGINTYGGAACPGDKTGNECFGSGVARDADDAKTMMSKHGVSPNANGTLTKLWNDGIDAFLAGNYSDAADKFSQVDSKYPNNYLVAKFLSASKDQVAQGNTGTTTASKGGFGAIDTQDSTSVVLVIALTVVAIMVLAVVITLIIILSMKPKQQLVPAEAYQMPPQYPPVQPNYPVQSVPVQQPVQYYAPPQVPPIVPQVAQEPPQADQLPPQPPQAPPPSPPFSP